jgi:hypothetical protein
MRMILLTLCDGSTYDGLRLVGVDIGGEHGLNMHFRNVDTDQRITVNTEDIRSIEWYSPWG